MAYLTGRSAYIYRHLFVKIDRHCAHMAYLTGRGAYTRSKRNGAGGGGLPYNATAYISKSPQRRAAQD